MALPSRASRGKVLFADATSRYFRDVLDPLLLLGRSLLLHEPLDLLLRDTSREA